MVRSRDVLRVLAPVLLHAVAREVDRALGWVLRSGVAPAHPIRDTLGELEIARLAGHAALAAALGLAAWVALAAWRGRAGNGLGAALAEAAGAFAPLYLRPALSVLALVSVAVQPVHPYAFTLPVALTQDWGAAQDVAAAAAVLALLVPTTLPRLPAPGSGSLFLMAFLACALLSPDWSRSWDGHPGNEPKTLRQAVAIGQFLTTDAEGVSGAMERLPVRPLSETLPRTARVLARESWRMLTALAHGPGAVGAGAIRATRITRQTVRGKDGGVFYVLAPGPSLLLAPALRIDRAVNLRHGTPGRLGVTLLLWNAVAALLVVAVFALVRDATSRPGLAAAIALCFALLPPYLFYAYQFYPETLGALVVAVGVRRTLFSWRGSPWALALLGTLLATLPWLHQKFLPLWIALVALAVWRAVDRLVPLRSLLALLAPQAVSAYLVALYNFAITGSVRPDALFLAWGPGGVSGSHFGEGALGLLLDARYGLLPYVPIYALAGAGLALGGIEARRLRLAMLPAGVYYLTVAAADNWSGAVSHLGRYVLPVTPVLIAAVALLVARLGQRRGALFAVTTLAGWSFVLGVALFADPHAANDGAVLLARSALGDGHVYVPDLFFRSERFGAPGQAARVAVALALLAGLTWWLARAARRGGATSPCRTLVGGAFVLLAAGLLLERWPPSRGPRFDDALAGPAGVMTYVRGGGVVRGEYASVSQGSVVLRVRSTRPLGTLTLGVDGPGVVVWPGAPRLVIPPHGTELTGPLEQTGLRVGAGGAREWWQRARLDVATPGRVHLRIRRGEPPASGTRP